MITSEFEYHLIAELITMPDRELAEKIELHIWYQCATPQPRILATYLNALKDSDEPETFYASANKILEASGMEFVRTPDGKYVSRTPSYKPPGYKEISFEVLDAAENQEPK